VLKRIQSVVGTGKPARIVLEAGAHREAPLVAADTTGIAIDVGGKRHFVPWKAVLWIEEI
jgi:hypothetical protein